MSGRRLAPIRPDGEGDAERNWILIVDVRREHDRLVDRILEADRHSRGILNIKAQALL